MGTLLVFLISLVSLDGSVSTTGRFDLQAEAQPLFRAKWLQERRSVPQSFAFDDAHGFVYVLQVEGRNTAGTHAEHGARGDLVLTKLSLDGNTIAGHMVLRGFGHGVAVGVETQGADVFIWTEVDSQPIADGVGRGSRVGRFRFVDGATFESTSATIQKFAPAEGARASTPSVDQPHGRVAIRCVSASDEWRTALYDLGAWLAAGAQAAFQPLCDIALPFAFGTVQGWCTFGSYRYVFAGEPTTDRNPPPGNAALWCIDWNSGALVDVRRTRALSGLAYREPEGVAVHVATGAPRLGVEVGVNLSTGWCMGGPWIKPENSGRWFLQSSVTVEGPARFSGVLPLPGNRDRYDDARLLPSGLLGLVRILRAER